MKHRLLLLFVSSWFVACGTSEPTNSSTPVADADDVAKYDTNPIFGSDTKPAADTATAADTTTTADSTADTALDTSPPPDTGTCTPDCADKQCGPDGCGSLCGVCIFGKKCSNLGKCIGDCEPQCEGKICGSDACGGSCGTCPPDFSCGSDGLCYEAVCDPKCDGKVCGPDGCGGTCGQCVNNDDCVDGQCVTGPCSGIPDVGLCIDDVAFACEAGQKVTVDCKETPGMMCGWNAIDGSYTCIPYEECVPQCDNKECGDDGCGGQCGNCPGGWPCEVYECKPKAGAACGYITPVGTCINNMLWYCGGDTLFAQKCDAVGKTCKFNPNTLKNECL